MSTENQLETKEIARRAADAAKDVAREASTFAHDLTYEVEGIAGDVSDATKGMAKRVTASAKDIYQSAAQKAGDAVVTTREFVGHNPVSVVFGAIALGAAIGVVLFLSRRKPTFSERYVEDPLLAMREAIVGALAPMAHRVHDGYDSARDGAGRAMDQLHHFGPGRSGGSLSDRLGRVGTNLKFW